MNAEDLRREMKLLEEKYNSFNPTQRVSIYVVSAIDLTGIIHFTGKVVRDMRSEPESTLAKKFRRRWTVDGWKDELIK